MTGESTAFPAENGQEVWKDPSTIPICYFQIVREREKASDFKFELRISDGCFAVNFLLGSPTATPLAATQKNQDHLVSYQRTNVYLGVRRGLRQNFSHGS